MIDYKKLKPTDICIKATEETRHEIIALLEKLGGCDYNNKKASWKRFDVPLYIEKDMTICGLWVGDWSVTEITLYELRQMAGVEEIKPSEELMKEIEKPIGNFVLTNCNTGKLLPDGVYYHYADVCTLLKKYADTETAALRKEVEELKSLVKRFSFACQTTGGTSGADNTLIELINESKNLLK
jgi:hypothetical protein